MNSFIVVAPAFNEEELIGTFILRTAALAQHAALEGIVIVDDGSRDRTVERIQATATDCAVPVRCVRLTRNFGHQNAVLAGLSVAHAWAEASEIDFIGLIDADLQDRPEDFVTLMAETGEHDVVFAVRGSRAESPTFRFLAAIFYRLLSLSSRVPVPRHAGTFSVIRRNVVAVILENADSDPYFPGLRAWVGYRQKGIAVARDARAVGNSRVGFFGLVRLATQAVFSYSNLPLRVMFAFGLTTSMFSLFAIVIFMLFRLLGVFQVTGIATIIVAVFLSLGVNSIYMAILAFMIDRASSKRRNPPFLIMRDDLLEPISPAGRTGV